MKKIVLAFLPLFAIGQVYTTPLGNLNRLSPVVTNVNLSAQSPVQSVNGQTGAVVITASSIGIDTNKINSSLQPSDTNGWVVSSHEGFATTNQLNGYFPLSGGRLNSGATIEIGSYVPMLGWYTSVYGESSIVYGGRGTPTVTLIYPDWEAGTSQTIASREWVGLQSFASTGDLDLKADKSIVTNAWAITKDPSGFAGDTDATGTFAFDITSRVLTLTNANGIAVYADASRIVNTNYLVWPTIGTNRGAWYCSIDRVTGTGKVSQAGWGLDDIQAATVYYQTETTNAWVYEETHGFMPWTVHRRFHLDPKLSSAYVSGLTVTTNGTQGFSMTTGAWMDEDIYHSISVTQTNCLVGFRNGALFQLRGPRTACVVTNVANGRCQYDLNGTLTDITTSGANDYFSMWCYVTPCTTADVMWVVGRAKGSLATIRTESPPDISQMAPTAESILLYQFIRKGSSGEFIEAVDYSMASVKGAQATSQSHSTLTGRDGADQHPTSAITGLTDALTGKVGTNLLGSVVVTNGSSVIIGGVTLGSNGLIYATNKLTVTSIDFPNYTFTIDSANSSGPRIQLGGFGSPNAFFEIGAYSAVNNFDSKDRNLRLFGDGCELRQIQATGFTGINKISPEATLHVGGDQIIDNNLTVNGVSKIILPTSTNGLSSGMLWNNSGTISIMP